MKKLTLSTTLTAIMLSTSLAPAQAEDRTFKQALEDCFFGLLFEDSDKKGIGVGLNVVSGSLGTYAYISATMTPDAFCADNKMASATFTHENYAKISEDLIRGEGDYISSLLNIAGCTTVTARSQVQDSMRKTLINELRNEDYSIQGDKQKSWKLYESMHVSAANQCVS